MFIAIVVTRKTFIFFCSLPPDILDKDLYFIPIFLFSFSVLPNLIYSTFKSVLKDFQ